MAHQTMAIAQAGGLLFGNYGAKFPGAGREPYDGYDRQCHRQAT